MKTRAFLIACSLLLVGLPATAHAAFVFLSGVPDPNVGDLVQPQLVLMTDGLQGPGEVTATIAGPSATVFGAAADGVYLETGTFAGRRVRPVAAPPVPLAGTGARIVLAVLLGTAGLGLHLRGPRSLRSMAR